MDTGAPWSVVWSRALAYVCRKILGVSSPTFQPARTATASSSFRKSVSIVVTDYLPLRGPGRAAHGASYIDFNTPLAGDGMPIFRDAWRYLLTTRSAAEDVAERDDE